MRFQYVFCAQFAESLLHSPLSGQLFMIFTSKPETSRKIASKSQPTRRCSVLPHAIGGRNSNPSGVHCPATPFSAARTVKASRSRSHFGKYSSLSAFGQRPQSALRDRPRSTFRMALATALQKSVASFFDSRCTKIPAFHFFIPPHSPGPKIRPMPG